MKVSVYLPELRVHHYASLALTYFNPVWIVLGRSNHIPETTVLTIKIAEAVRDL